MIFISHNHADKMIAYTLKQHLSQWGVDSHQIWQSSKEGQAPNIGTGIRDEQVNALTKTKLIILIYTRGDEEWSWCMWECGIAAGGSARILVLECGDDSSSIFKDDIKLKLTSEAIHNFTKQFHKEDQFVPGMPAFAPWLAEDLLKARGRGLYEELKRIAEVLPESRVFASDQGPTFSKKPTGRVFLCHSSADKSDVRALYRRLKEDQFNPWLDEEDLLGGQNWKEEIPRKIRNSDAVIVCLSRNSVTKAGYVQKEIRIALDKLEEQPGGRVFVIPIKLEDCEIPNQLQELHCLNFFDEAGYDLLKRSLHAALQTARGEFGA